MTDSQITRVCVMRSNGYRVTAIAEALGVSRTDVVRILNPDMRQPQAVEEDLPAVDDAAKAVRYFLRRGYSDEIIMANFGDVVSRSRLDVIKNNLAKGA